MIKISKIYRQIFTKIVNKSQKGIHFLNNNNFLGSPLNNYLPLFNKASSMYAFSSFDKQFREQQDNYAKQVQDFKHYFQLSNTFYDQKKVREAVEALEKAKQIILLAQCQKSRLYVEMLLNLVAMYKELEDYSKIKQYLQEGHAIINNLQEQNQEIKLIINGNLSQFYFAQRKYQESLNILQQSQKILTGQSPELTLLYDKIGQVLLQLQRYQDSLTYLKKSKEMLDRNTEQQSEQYLNILDKIGFAYYSLKRYEESVEVHKRKLQYQEKLMGKDNMGYVQTLKSLGFIHRHLELPDMAMEYLEKAFEIAKALNQLDNPLIYPVTQFLAVFQYERQNYSQALEYFDRCLHSLETSNLQSYTKYTYILKSLGDCNKFIQKFQIAYERYNAVLALLDPKSSEYAYVLAEIGQIYFFWHQYGKSLEAYTTSLQIDRLANQDQTLHSYNLYGALVEVTRKLSKNDLTDKYQKLREEFQRKHSELLKNP